MEQSASLFSRARQATARWFPVPQFLLPPAAGIDISDTSIKWMVLDGEPRNAQIRSFGHEPLPEGVVQGGLVRDSRALGAVLASVKEKLGGVSMAHAGLPEEVGYVFTTRVPEGSDRAQVLSMIEFELEGRVPISLAEALYDFDAIGGGEISVSVFPRDVVESYAAAFAYGGITLLSLEMEARAVARAVSGEGEHDPVSLVVDFGRTRSGIAVLKHGVPIFTSTVVVGGERIDKAFAGENALSPAEIASFKDTQGLRVAPQKKARGAEVLSSTVSALADEVARHYQYWDTRRGEGGGMPLERVLLVGGNANIKGLADYLAARVRAECIRPNVWQRVCDFERYIPPIEREESLQFATAIGLALRAM